MIVIGAAALAAVLLGLWMRQSRPEFGLYLSLAATVWILLTAWGQIRDVIELLRRLGEATGVQDLYMSILFKILGITYVAEFTAGVCRDAGYAALGSQLVIVGKFMICAVSLPVLLALLRLAEQLLGG